MSIDQVDKKCTKCKTEKSLLCFYKDTTKVDGLHTICKVCHNSNVEKWNSNNPAKRKAIVKKYCDTNREGLNKKTREYYKNNKEIAKKSKQKWLIANEEKAKKTAILWRSKNKHKRKILYLKYMEKPGFRLNNSMRQGVYNSIKKNKNGRNWEGLVGFSLDQLKKHLKKNFLPGMSFENYGEWHVDHILPISKFNFKKARDEDFKKCWALKNLQPLWASDNIKKKDRLDKPMQVSFIFGD